MAHSVFHTGYQIPLNLSLDDLGHPDRPNLWSELHGKCKPGVLLCLECLDADPGCPQWMYVQLRRGVRLACHYSNTSARHPGLEGNRHKAMKERIVVVAGSGGYAARTEAEAKEQKRYTDVLVTGANGIQIAHEIQFSHSTAKSARQRTVDARRAGRLPTWTVDTSTAPLIDRMPWTRIDRQPWENLRRPGNPLLIRGGIRQLYRDRCYQSPRLCPKRWGGTCDGWHGTWQAKGRQFDEFVLLTAAQQLVPLHLPALGDDRRRDAYIWVTPEDRQRYVDSGAPVVPDEDAVPAEQPAEVMPKPIDPKCRWLERKDYVPPPADQRDTGDDFGSSVSLGAQHQFPADVQADPAAAATSVRRPPRPAPVPVHIPVQRQARSYGTQIGPCVRCRQPTTRYGAGASPLCATCRATPRH
ncbi:hypothetical protein OG851_43305 (plasmid) [Streptomyces sp. NBC_00161]|uniref:competence protein CoiA family protein n=1 Tax=Streptomyces sp. NBC_00161 TaxID=2975671 RepID=UPI002F9126F7